ncbi:MAG: hypothetical protein ACO3B1_06700 [Candidatus Nanopelagicaceae bacterium]
MKEQELFDYLKDKHFPDLEKSESTYDSFDCTSQTKGLYIELKCRHTHYPDLLIEQSKYQRLVLEATYHNLAPWYINSTPEGKWGFDLSRVPEPNWEERWMPTTTEFANTSKKMKVVGFLHLDYGLPL